jgi:hypothetical protein
LRGSDDASRREIGKVMPTKVQQSMKRSGKKVTMTREDVSIPVWLQATESFYKKLARVAGELGLSRYEALNRGLDLLLHEARVTKSPLARRLKDQDKEKSFRETMSRLSRDYWSTKTPEERRLQGQKAPKGAGAIKASGRELHSGAVI